MGDTNQRKFERVETHVKVKLPGDAAWTECINSNVSGGGLFFEAIKPLNTGDFVNLQFMLQAKSGTLSNVHFFASAKVIRITPGNKGFRVAVEFIVDEEVRKEILKLIEKIKSENLKVARPITHGAVLRKLKPE
jgi:hypothetical protein